MTTKTGMPSQIAEYRKATLGHAAATLILRRPRRYGATILKLAVCGGTPELSLCSAALRARATGATT